MGDRRSSVRSGVCNLVDSAGLQAQSTASECDRRRLRCSGPRRPMADDKDRVLMRLRDRPLSRLELSGAEQGIVVRLAAEGQVGRVELDAADVESVDIVCRVCSSGSSSCPKGDLQTPTRFTIPLA